MSGGNLIDCAKRLAKVLVGQPEPSVVEVVRMAKSVVALGHDTVSGPLKVLYDSVAMEPVPSDFGALLMNIDKGDNGPRHFVPPSRGEHNGGGRSIAD